MAVDDSIDPKRVSRRPLARAGLKSERLLWPTKGPGAFEDEEQLLHYYSVMGPLYSLKFDPEKARESRARGIRSVDAINEGFGGFLRTYDVTGDIHKVTAPTLVIGGRHADTTARPMRTRRSRLVPYLLRSSSRKASGSRSFRGRRNFPCP